MVGKPIRSVSYLFGLLLKRRCLISFVVKVSFSLLLLPTETFLVSLFSYRDCWLLNAFCERRRKIVSFVRLQKISRQETSV